MVKYDSIPNRACAMLAVNYEDIVIFENLCFRPSTRKREVCVFKTSILETVFNEPACLVPHNAVYVMTEG